MNKKQACYTTDSAVFFFLIVLHSTHKLVCPSLRAELSLPSETLSEFGDFAPSAK